MNRQCERILRYARQNGGSITSTEADDNLGIKRLASRIHDLKACGVEITDDWETGPNRYGEPTRWKRYYVKNPPPVVPEPTAENGNET